MPELVAVGTDPGRVVKCTCRQSPDSGCGFKRETKIGTATAAEGGLEPTAGFIGDMAVGGQSFTAERDLIFVIHQFDAEGRAGAPLAPSAMANSNTKRFRLRLEPRHAAHAPP